MRIFTIDIGTNSTLYLIADVVNTELKVLERGIEGNGLGANLAFDGKLSQKVLELNRDILQRILERAKRYQCECGAAVGTAALRTAVNKDEFIRMAKSLGLKLEVISDTKEAHLGWKGIFGLKGVGTPSAVLDLGGGSTELVYGKSVEPEWVSSVPLGAVILAKRYFIKDPPSQEEIDKATREVCQAFEKWKYKVNEFKTTAQVNILNLVGAAGTVTALAAIEYGILEYKPDIFNGLRLSFFQVNAWCQRLLAMSLSERRAIPGMPPVRAEYIHAGALILTEILRLLDIPALTVSDRGVMFGLAYELMGL